ncbi:ATP-binding protein [Streptomyces kanamyceticus]|uniref:ATP-binding protein n=1 Tax=Streptomyces kanamyceticus TaxID=1967 RepID=UPI0006E14AAA|nr:ATP-binding protein [Streptomyces kanamyceticus]
MNQKTPLPSRREPRERFYRRERQSVPQARAFARTALNGWGIHDRAYEIALCVSELTTNALLHGVPPGRGFLLCLSHDGGVLRIELHDSGGGWPMPGTDVGGDGDAESGRGLLLVAALADKWGVVERDPGKIVWCEFVTDVPGVSGRTSRRPRG